MNAISDYEERRRIQNLVAQRKWRQKLRARQRSVSQSIQIHHKPDEGFKDHHMWQPSSAHTAQAIHGPGNDSQGIISLENPLSTDGLGAQDPIASSAGQTIGSTLVKSYPPEVDMSRSPFRSDDYAGIMVDARDTLSKGHIDNGLLSGLNPNMGHDYSWQFPDCEAGQTAPFDRGAAQNCIETHIDGTDLQTTADIVRNQIIRSIERAEILYEYGAVMQLFPPNKSFQKHLADAKTGVVLAPTGYQTHF
ncbi:uncharacterized protein APUU_61117A [Aspergillus puulaauensis]|uniref:BZIP domain-containing protein n=1 Tax=Aspergillus puulaauensis TaxID=1220207 RepID=A0A7R7XV63_9EURO|nr:uncharacterized protein APUU_61117A [Aspergillus puulaauensis]BCS28069.1 hypothetical protein APUU_61117A [Aspergillus puulaauensis]